jgi:hypothetical protein
MPEQIFLLLEKLVKEIVNGILVFLYINSYLFPKLFELWPVLSCQVLTTCGSL